MHRMWCSRSAHSVLEEPCRQTDGQREIAKLPSRHGTNALSACAPYDFVNFFKDFVNFVLLRLSDATAAIKAALNAQGSAAWKPNQTAARRAEIDLLSNPGTTSDPLLG